MPDVIAINIASEPVPADHTNENSLTVTGAIACGVTFFSGLASATSAACGATGAAILEASGYAAYNVKDAATAGAAGGAALAVPVAVVLACCTKFFGNKNDKNEKKSIGQIALSAGMSALSGVLGYAMVYSNGNSDMSLGNFAAATAVGSAVINGGFLVLGNMCRR